MICCCYDISKYDTVDSFRTAYTSGYVFAWVKASRAKVEDRKFEEYITRLHTLDSIGQMYGTYHFGDYAYSGKEQALFYLNTLARVEQKLGITLKARCLDFETFEDHSMSLHDAEEFIQVIEEKTGTYPVLYGGSLLKEITIPKSSPLLKCKLWLAQYSDTYKLPKGWDKVLFWQFTGDGVGPTPHYVPGIRNKCDISKFDGTVQELREWYSSLG